MNFVLFKWKRNDCLTFCDNGVSGKLLFSSFGSKFLLANQIGQFFNVEYLQTGWIIWLYLLCGDLAFWLEPTQ